MSRSVFDSGEGHNQIYLPEELWMASSSETARVLSSIQPFACTSQNQADKEIHPQKAQARWVAMEAYLLKFALIRRILSWFSCFQR